MKRVIVVACAAAGLLAGYAVWSLLLLRGDDGDVDRLARELGVAAGATVADVGAGAGEWAVRLADVVGPGGRVYATEVDAGRLARLRERAAGRPNGTLAVVEASPTSTGLDAGCCDLVVLRGVYHHFDDGVATSRQLLDALRPGGRLAIVDFAPDGPWRWHFWLIRAAHGAGRHGHGVSLDDVRREAQAAGGHVVRQVAGWSGGYHLSVIERAGDGPPEATPTSGTRE